MKFTTLIPKTRNDGTPFLKHLLDRVIEGLWKPFGAMSQEGEVIGRWTHEGIVHSDLCIKISIECSRDRLQEAIRAVQRAGRKLRQKAMYFEVTGYDGVQILALGKTH